MPTPIGRRPASTPGPAAPTVASRPVDVGTLGATELARLRQTQPAVARVVDQAKATWAPELARSPPLRLLVTTSAANGGLPVLVLAAPGFDPSKPATVHTHYHGDLTAVAAPGGSHTENIREQLAKEPQRLWVLPEAAGNVGARGTNWSNAKDQAGTARDALVALGLEPAPGSKHVVSAHSAGGRALAASMTAGNVKADQLVLLDCLYESTSGPGANTAILNAVKRGALTNVKDVVVVATGSYPDERNVKLREAGGPVVRMETVVPRAGLSNHEAAARNHLVPRGW